jgi:radical SAM protein with 4Fe4S-binding SPASM domain
VKVVLKTVILRTNQAEVVAMEALARDFGVPFRCDPVLTPALDGGRTPLSERVEPEVAARFEYASEVKRQRSREYLAKMGSTSASERIYQCGAAVTSFYMTSSGRLRPCLMTTDMEFDAVSLGFEAAWREATRAIGKPTWHPGAECRSCEDLPICGHCPALLRLETGRESSPSQYLCRLGEARRGILDAPEASGINLMEEAHV